MGRNFGEYSDCLNEHKITAFAHPSMQLKLLEARS